MNTFICAWCGGEFGILNNEEWNEKKVDKEAEEYFGIKDASKRSDMAIVYEACWQEIKPDQKWRG